MEGRVIHLGMGLGEHTDDFTSCPEDGTIAVGSHDVDGTIGIEGWIETHTGTYAGALHLTLGIDLGSNGIPTQDGLRSVGQGIEPALRDTVGVGRYYVGFVFD